MSKRKHTTISIPIALYNKIKKRIRDTGFTSVSEWTTYVLREILISLEEKKEKAIYTKEEEKRIKRKLRALGYIG